MPWHQVGHDEPYHPLEVNNFIVVLHLRIYAQLVVVLYFATQILNHEMDISATFP